MEQAPATPETEKEKRRKWILLIAMLLSLAVLIISIVFLARIKGWLGGSESSSLLSIVDSETPAPDGFIATFPLNAHVPVTVRVAAFGDEFVIMPSPVSVAIV